MGILLRTLKPVLLTTAAVGITGAAVAAVGTTLLAAAAIRALRGKPLAPGAVVLITGGSRGLGLAIASRFAQKPVKLVLASRTRT